MEEAIIKVVCDVCGGGPRNHRVLAEKKTQWSDEVVVSGGTYQMCEC